MRLFSLLPTTAVGIALQQQRDVDFKIDDSIPYAPKPPQLSKEHQLAYRYFQKGGNVLELGGRYGTTSCALSKAVGKQGRVVAVEPDASVYPMLTANLKDRGCQYNVRVLPGTIALNGIANKRQNPQESVLLAPNELFKNSTVPENLYCSLPDLEQHVGFHFNGVLADCEGCLRSIVDDHVGGGLANLTVGDRDWPYVLGTHKLLEVMEAGMASTTTLSMLQEQPTFETDMLHRVNEINTKFMSPAEWNRTKTDPVEKLSSMIEMIQKKNDTSESAVGKLSALLFNLYYHHIVSTGESTSEKKKRLKLNLLQVDKVHSFFQSGGYMEMAKMAEVIGGNSKLNWLLYTIRSNDKVVSAIQNQYSKIMKVLEKRRAILSEAAAKGVFQSINTLIIEGDGTVDYKLLASDLTELGMKLKETLPDSGDKLHQMKHIVMTREKK